MGLSDLIAKEVLRELPLPNLIRGAVTRKSRDAILYEVWVSRAVATALAASSRLARWPLTSALVSIGEETLRVETAGLEAVAVASGLNPSSDKPETNHYRLVRHVLFSASSSGPAPVLAVAYGRARLREVAAQGCSVCGVWASKEFSVLAARVAHALDMAEFLDLDEVIESVRDYLLVEKVFYSSVP